MRDIWAWISVTPDSGPVCAVLEKVGGFIGDNYGIPGMGSAMFNFGTSFGALEMALTAARIPFEIITPAKWQSGVGVVGRKKSESKTVWKNRLKAHAERLFPGIKVTLAIADSLLIATYCKRKHEGTL